MAVALIAILASGGVYLWAEKYAGGDSSTSVATLVKIDDADVNKHLKSLGASNDTLYGVTQPAFDTLSNEQQKEFLQKVLKLANERNLQKVNILNSKGRSVAFASAERLELTAQ